MGLDPGYISMGARHSGHVQAALAQVGLWKEKRERLQILDGVSGVLQPSRMTLLLGPPSSGKSTLLKALAGLLTPDRNLKVHNHFKSRLLLRQPY